MWEEHNTRQDIEAKDYTRSCDVKEKPTLDRPNRLVLLTCFLVMIRRAAYERGCTLGEI
jgi:hypothetical protein